MGAFAPLGLRWIHHITKAHKMYITTAKMAPYKWKRNKKPLPRLNEFNQSMKSNKSIDLSPMNTLVQENKLHKNKTFLTILWIARPVKLDCFNMIIFFYLQEFYNGDLLNCERTHDKMGRTAQASDEILFFHEKYFWNCMILLSKQIL